MISLVSLRGKTSLVNRCVQARIKWGAVLAVAVMPVLALADLVEMDDTQMSDVSGQAMMDVVTLVDPGGLTGGNQQSTKFVRIRTGARVELNANIDRLILGERERTDKYTTYSAAFESQGRNLAHYRNRLFYNSDSARDTCGTNGNCLIPGSDIGVTTGADIIIENLSLGSISNGSMSPMIMENPYIELVYDNEGAEKGQLIGIRFGAESQTGDLGNYSTYGVGADGCLGGTNTSAACSAYSSSGIASGSNPDTSRQGGVLSYSGNFNLLAGSSFLIGYSVMAGVSRTNYTPVVAGSGGGILGGLNLLAPNATQTLGNIAHDNTQEFFLSFASREIFYPSISGDTSRMKVGNDILATIPGVSLNITDGIALTLPQALGTLNGGVPKISNCYNGNMGVC